MFVVIGTNTYQKEISKWPHSDRAMAKKIPAALAQNPMSGSPLGYSFLREKRVGGRRVYYLVYEDLNLVLLVAASGKKDQQATIDHIREHLEKFRELAEDIAKQVS